MLTHGYKETEVMPFSQERIMGKKEQITCMCGLKDLIISSLNSYRLGKLTYYLKDPSRNADMIF